MWNCECCGLPACRFCQSDEGMDQWMICEACEALLPEDRERVRAFRLEMNK